MRMACRGGFREKPTPIRRVASSGLDDRKDADRQANDDGSSYEGGAENIVHSSPNFFHWALLENESQVLVVSGSGSVSFQRVETSRQLPPQHPSHANNDAGANQHNAAGFWGRAARTSQD